VYLEQDVNVLDGVMLVLLNGQLEDVLEPHLDPKHAYA
jgi:hypothetical protein